MSIFSAPSFYAAPDRQTYSAGNYFIPQEKYTFGGVPRYLMPSGITATTAANAIPPILPINQGGGGGDGPGGGFDTSAPEDQSTTADDFGFGLEGDDPSMNMTEEEKDAIDAYNNPATTKGMLGTAFGSVLGFIDPFTAIASLNYQRNKAKEAAMEQARAAATAARAAENKAAGRGGYQSDFAQDSDFMDGPSGAGYGMGASDKGGSDTMGSFMNGGLVDLVDIYD